MNLDFSKHTVEEILSQVTESKPLDWQEPLYEFLEQWVSGSDTVIFNKKKGEYIYGKELDRQFAVDNATAVGKIIGLERGNTALLSHSAKSKEGVVVLIQSIELGLNLYVIEPTDKIEIPYTGRAQDTVHFGLDYAYITDEQAKESISVLHRIANVVIAADSINTGLRSKLLENNKSQIYEALSVDSFPLAIKELDASRFRTLPGVKVSTNENLYLEIESGYSNKTIEVPRPAVILSENSFRWLGNSEIQIDGKNIVDLQHIEEVLDPHIDANFSVINFPEPETKKEVITLVIEGRFVEELNYPTDELKDYEIPKQTFFLGVFPDEDDKAAIRKELKKLLKEGKKKA